MRNSLITQITKNRLRGFRHLGFALLLVSGVLACWCPVAFAAWGATVPNPIMEYHYTYDNNGNITKIEDKVNGIGYNQSFTYDEVDRLSSAIGPYGNQNYTYDSVGNTLDITPPVTNTYDNGNVTDYNGKHIDYDYENRPVKITNSNNNTITEFAYDYSGQRVYTKVNSGTITSEDYYVGNIYEEKYYVDSSSPTISASTTTVTNIYAGSIRVAGLTTQTTATGTENNTLYYHGDHLGSSSIITDGTGTVVRDISYQPWGNVDSNTEESGANTLDPKHKFTGQILDDSTDLYYYGARYYDPVLRRFITPDTIVQAPYDPQSLNRYAYCRNNPLNLIDPTGNSWLSETWRDSGAGDWWNKNRYYVATAAVIAATWGAGTLFEAGTLGAEITSSALMGEISGATFGGISAANNGGDVGRAMFTGAAIGGAQGAITGGMFYGIDNAGMNPLMEIAVKGHIGGVMTEMMGGKYETGFMYMAGAATLDWAYTSMVGYGPNPHPGEPLPKGTYKPNAKGQPPQGKAVFGKNEPLNGRGDFWKQAGTIGKIGNRVPIGNAIGALHDTWMNNVIFNEFKSWGSMLGAAPITIGAAMGSCWAPLTVNIAIGESK